MLWTPTSYRFRFQNVMVSQSAEAVAGWPDGTHAQSPSGAGLTAPEYVCLHAVLRGGVSTVQGMVSPNG
jgi:hypothetical protein